LGLPLSAGFAPKTEVAGVVEGAPNVNGEDLAASAPSAGLVKAKGGTAALADSLKMLGVGAGA
jgi:hypothetical protein